MKTTLLVFAICSLLLLSPAIASPAGPLDEDAIRTRIAASPSLKNAGDADAIILFEGDTIDYADGKAVWRHQELIRLYSEYAIEHLGDPRVAWDARRQVLEIHANRTYLNDGHAQDAPGNAHNRVTPHGLDLAVDFLDLREVVITRVGLERGVTVWLDYTITDITPGWLPYGRHFFLHSEFPVAERELHVTGLAGETVNPEGAFAKLADPQDLFWRAENLPARPRDLGPRTGDQLPWVAIYEVENWPTLGEALAAACKASFNDLGSLESELETLEEEHHPLGIEDRLDMWMDWIADRTARVRHGLLPWSRAPRTVAQVLETSTATDFERAMLLLACCRAEEWPVEAYFPTRWRSLADGPVVASALNSPGVFVKSRKGKPVHVDSPSWSKNPRAEPSLMVSLGETPAVRWKKIWKVDDRIALKVFWDLDAGEAKAEVSLFGPAAQRMGLKQPQDLLSDWAAGWGEEAEASNIAIHNLTPAILQGSLDIKAAMPKADDDGYVIIEPPFPPLAPSDFRPAGLDHADRDAAWLPGNLLSYDCAWEIILPEGWEVKLPEAREATFANGAYGLSITQDERCLNIVYKLNWNEEAIDSEQWPAFRAAFLDAQESEGVRIVLSPVKE
jgi:hypothetical protein